MMSLLFFTFAIASAWRGFDIGGTTGFAYLMGAVVLVLFGLAAAGLDAPRHVGHRPPEHAPGYRNKKRK
jgi:hypothetical protein